MNFCKTKLKIALAIMGAGMLVALLFHGWQGWRLGKGYPYNTFLSHYTPFTDYSDQVVSARLPNPYIIPSNPYLPFAYFAFKLPALLPDKIGLFAFFFISLAGLYLLLIKTLKDIVENPWLRVGASLLLIGLSYPVLYCIDRGNPEIVVVFCVGCCLYFYNQGRYVAGTLWLLPAACSKVYTLLFLILLMRQRKWGLVFAAVCGFLILTVFSAYCFAGHLRATWHLYSRDANYTMQYFYEDSYMEESASPWNMYKIVLIKAAEFGLIQPVDFDWDGPFILASYHVYAVCAVICIVFLAGYVWFIEKEFLRCAILSLVFMATAYPSSGDYRMVHVGIALALLIRIKSRRPNDISALMLLAFVLVPKKLMFYSFSSYPVTTNISIQVFLNPICMLMAMALLLCDGWRNYDPSWTKLRVERFSRSIPWLGKLWPNHLSQDRATIAAGIAP